MGALKKKRRISKAESAELAPLVKDLNKLAKDFVGIFKTRNEEKEKRVSVLISQIKIPKKGKGGVDVTNIDISPGFLKKMRKRKRPRDSNSEWDEYFSVKKGWVI